MSAAVALEAIGIGTSLIGGLGGSNAEKRAAKNNALFNEYQANVVDANAKEQETRYRRLVRRQMGAARAAVGGSGVQMTGSALEVIGDSAAEAELQALTIRYEGKIQAESFMRAARLGVSAGDARAHAMRLSSVGDTLIGTGRLIDKL